ncbi:MAG: PQQ-dependent sugar dehydrogenase [Rhodothalassiaceae bacterium]
MIRLLTGLAAAFVLAACSEPAAEDSQEREADAATNTAAVTTATAGTVDPASGIALPQGFLATVFARDVGFVRHLAVRADGVVYGALRRMQDGGGIVALADDDADGVADRSGYFGDRAGTGLAIHDGYLYFSSDSEILRYRLGPGLVPDNAPETIVSGFPSQRQHATKPMTFDDAGNMYVTVGAPSNACQERMRTAGSPGLAPCPQRDLQAGIWRFDANRPGQVHGKDGERIATGIRNGLAIDWNASAGALYFATHGRDQLGQLFPEYYTAAESAEQPAEEFHRVVPGGDYGWPYTYWDPQRGARMKAPEYGGDGKTEAEAGKYQEPLVAFPAHWAPNDLVFYEGEDFPEEYRHGAFLAFHGSWNRAPRPQEGYNVSFVPMTAEGEVSGPWRVFADGFKGKAVLASPGDAAHRPSGLAIGPDGALFIGDDKAGWIWKVRHAEP